MARTATSADVAGALGITPDMFRAGVSAYKQWDAEREEIELLVAGIFYAMSQAAPNSVLINDSSRAKSGDCIR